MPRATDTKSGNKQTHRSGKQLTPSVRQQIDTIGRATNRHYLSGNNLTPSVSQQANTIGLATN
jgi:hypothetical protein